MTVIRWIVWAEGDRVVGIDAGFEIDIETTLDRVTIGDRDAVTVVHTREEMRAVLARYAALAEEEWALCEADA